jgi:hypothetical protein
MIRFIRSTCFFFLMLAPIMVQAGQLPELSGTDGDLFYGGPAPTSKTSVDTTFFIGPWSSTALVNGQFEDLQGYPAWNGWTHHDMTAPLEARWSVSTYQADNLAGHGLGNLAVWCGEMTWPACQADDPEGGYGNNYHESLSWFGTVADPSAPCTVTVDAWLNHDLEPGYDYFLLRYHRFDDYPFTVMSQDGLALNYHMQESFVVSPAEYMGDPGQRDQIELEFLVTSDGAYSDQDCFFPSAGACQIDDIAVTLDNGGLNSFDDFQSGEFGSWTPTTTQGVGDFAHIMWNLEDIDPCVTNYTPQVCFIDDGYVIPETGGQMCIDWCYGPEGYIVNTRGGLAGPDSYLHNQVRSPVIAWPASGAEGANLTFGVYNHEDLSMDAPGIFYTWHVRTISSDSPEDIETAPWADRNFLYYGPPEYRRLSYDISDLMLPGTTYFQMALGVMELGYFWGFDGDDGYPAPYFDNVRVVGYPFSGPAIFARGIDLAQDGFPAEGVLNQDDLSRNYVRFDMARNIALADDGHIDPGDSIIARISPRRPGADLVGMPKLHFKLEPNADFDPYRTSGLGTEGDVDGFYAPVPGGPQLDLFAFDLPDSGFLFPGDILHYYISATSFLGGSELTNILPADTTGFTDFSGVLAYDPAFTVRALPTCSVHGYSGLLEPDRSILLWMDGGDLSTWDGALEVQPLDPSGGYDVFQTRGPSSGVGNGLGSRATVDLMSSYTTLLYSCGTQISSTICNGDLAIDGSDDVGLLDGWMSLGGRSMFLTGDNLVSDMSMSGSAAQSFLTDWMKVQYLNSDVRYLINMQAAPLVLSLQPEVFYSAESWVAYGGCLSINTFDAVQAMGPEGVRLAEFTSPDGQGGQYPYSAATLYDLPEDKTVIPDHNSAVISMPYDLEFIFPDPGGDPAQPPFFGRNAVLLDVLWFFGDVWIWGDVDVPVSQSLQARCYPNPFNPVTTVDYSLPRAGHLSVKVFNVRGQLVTTLVDEKRDSGPGSVAWDGTDHRGAKVSSGVYFCEVRAGREVKVQKLALLK